MIKYFEQLYNKDSIEFFEFLKKKINKKEKTFIITANPETFMKAEKDDELDKMLTDKSVIKVPDGIGIVKAAKMVNFPVKERITGIDISVELLDYLNEIKGSLYLFGSSKEVSNKMKEVIKDKYSNIKLLGVMDGYVKDKDDVFDKIKKLDPDVIMVALGIPMQEKLIYKHLKEFKHGVLIGVGGSFDVISGYKKRAPKLFIKLNLEWLYRIIKEPSRLKRFWNSNVKFLLLAKNERKK